jgi:glycosyltransferase involved in cell wall biosynthesis
LRDRELDFECLIAGDGPERQHLESLIRENRLQDQLKLLGHVGRSHLDSLYRRADVVVLTSRSEGIPLVLMEALIRRRLVLAPAITGIPEIVIPGKTGFLYKPGALEDLVARILFLDTQMRSEDRYPVSRLDWVRHAAEAHVFHNFDRRKNLVHFADQFLQLIATRDVTDQNWRPPHEDLVLQQI